MRQRFNCNTGVMEYETYETEATYDDMYEEGTKGKVWFSP